MALSDGSKPSPCHSLARSAKPGIDGEVIKFSTLLINEGANRFGADRL
jgi:hypothetical protein